MTDHDLHVEVQGDEIVVTLPGMSYRVVYCRPASTPGLMAKYHSGRREHGSPMTEAEFHVRAQKAAYDKARELGWII
jgi:hypothetical protein